MIDDLWSAEQVAECLGWATVRTVHRATWASRAKVGHGIPLDPTDLPLPAHIIGRSPFWRPTDIRAMAAARARALKAPRPRVLVPPQPRSMRASEVRPGDVVYGGVPRLRRWVLAVEQADGDARLLLAARRRDPGRWVLFPGEAVMAVHRPTPPVVTG